MKKWIYSGVFLDGCSRKKLKNKFSLPDGWVECFDHMTLSYNDGSEYVKYVKSLLDGMVGKKVKLKVVAQGISESAYAVKVQVPAGLPTSQKITHITLGYNPNASAVYSNYIENWNELYDSFYVYGTIRHFES